MPTDFLKQKRNGVRSLALIPARAGSRRIKDKNIAELGGKPLIAWTIETLLHTGCFDRVLVSTDSISISEVSRTWGAEVPFLRSAETASPSADLLDAVTETLDRLFEWDGFYPDILGIFLPTSPFRRTKTVQRIFMQMLQGAQAGNLVRPIHLDLGTLFYKDSSGRLQRWKVPRRGSGREVLFRDNMSVAMRRIDWDALSTLEVTPETPRYFRHYLSWFRTNDYVYLDSEDINRGIPDEGRWVFEAFASYEESIDINTPLDLQRAERIAKAWDN
ncbi:MAG: acylneuraminate cytidylyltransferase family protein [Thermodesulfobacteriota bacterium]